ncbi:hypothetical protein [Pelagibacterium montanilacus]|uniref:hypothetical protein n=1 Tax=Pelagibacterium montanilacus TaxID=2185280 RepID=UPI000F8C9C61|nr:hypothetical protein [Pelagibacterium montanilacus]
MSISLSGHKAAPRLMSCIAALVALASVGACTTMEGTNALSDVGTFEREVMRPTLQGVGIIGSEEKALPTTERAPLVVPAAGSTPPPPQQSSAQIPEDRSGVVVDSAGLTEADLVLLREGRVASGGLSAGRPLTEAETRQLAARMAAYRRAQGTTQRNIYMPPAEYFTRVDGANLICETAGGELVAVTDPSCPAETRAALSR